MINTDSEMQDTFTSGELDEYRFFFSGSNAKIISEFLSRSNAFYDTIKMYYERNEFKNCILLGEKYLLLNNSEREFNKANVLKMMICILADVQQRYDDAVIYGADLLSITENESTLIDKNTILGGIYTA